MSEDIKDIQSVESVSEETPNQTSSYRSIFKATSLFGGVQVYQILVGIIKSKIIAVLLGPLGVGILGLYTSAEQLLKSITSMGLQSSAVRDLSEANNSGDNNRISLKITVLKRLIFLTGLLGMIVMAVLSPLLSKVSFGDYTYIVPFVFFSVCMLLDQLCNGQKIILQGLRKLKPLAIVTAIGSTVGLLASIPVYYFWGVKGIVPALILTSAASLLFTWLITRKIKVKPISLSNKEVFKEGSTMLKLGIAMSVSGIIGTLSAYIIRSFIRAQGGVDDVGLFTAGFMLMNTYTGMVFTAMSTDYFPRLAAVNKDNAKCREIINQQGEIGVLILLPLLLVCMVFVPFIVRILYSDEFMPANGYILWACSGMLFKMASWAVSYVYVAKAEAKLFAIIEISSNVISMVFSMLGYIIGGMTGLGITFSLAYIVYLVIVYVMAHKKYDFSFSNVFRGMFIFESVLLFSCLAIVLLLPLVYKYIFGSILIIVATYYSLRELNKRIGLTNFIKSHGKKKR